MKKTIIAAGMCSLLLACGVVHAKEGGDQYPNGAETWFAGAVPPPGNYFVNYLGHWSGSYKDGGGHTVKQANGRSVDMQSTFDTVRFLQVTDQKIFGAQWAWHAFLPVVDLDIDKGGKAGKTGVGDAIVDPFILAWHGNEWHAVAALDIYLPTGVYYKDDPRKSIGANYYSFEPVFGVTYLGRSGWEVSTKFMYNIKTENHDTRYQSGDEFHVDYLVGKHFGNWGVGISGYYLKQVTDDKQYGSKVGSDGTRGQVFAYGPSVQYTTKGGVHLIGQWQHETMVENRFGGDKLWFKMILPL